MTRSQDAIVHALSFSMGMLGGYVSDFSPADYLHRPFPRCNCAAWLLGHLVLTERGAMALMGAGGLPELPDGFEDRFARDTDAPHAATYGDVTVLLPLLKRHRALLIEAVDRATDEQLNRPMPNPSGTFKVVAERINFIALHTILHGGQITVIRRSLGRPPIV